MTDITITEADREAFARLDGHEPGDMGWRMIVESRPDCHGSYIMARHRLSAIEEAAKIAEKHGTRWVAKDIRALAQPNHKG